MPTELNPETVTIRQAVLYGLRSVSEPQTMIIIATLALCGLLLFLHFTLWDFLLLPAAPTLSFLYANWAIPRWKIWAYEHVADLDQLQRSAELAGILAIQSYQDNSGFISSSQKAKLVALEKRFSEEPVFVDDPSIPAETPFYNEAKEAALILKDTGIELGGDGFFKWDQIDDEHVGTVGFMTSGGSGAPTSGGATADYLRFNYPGGRFDVPLSVLNISAWQLDLLLYIYRGRFNRLHN